MQYWRVYAPEGVKAGVVGVPPKKRGKDQRQTLWLPTSPVFQGMWDKAKDRVAVLDKTKK